MEDRLCDKIDALALDIAKSYQSDSPDILLAREHIPQKQEIIQVVHLLQALLYPGFFEPNPASAPGLVRVRLEEIYHRLHAQLSLALRLRPQEQAFDPDEATEIVCTLLGKIPAMRRNLVTDVEAAFAGDPSASSKSEIIAAFPGLFAVSVYRLAHELFQLSVPLIPRIMAEYAHSTTGIDIHPGAKIGSHFFIDHGTGVVIGETTEIGRNVKLYQGVTLGALSTRAGQALRGIKRHPTIEDEVVIYAGASILGGETVIGRGAVIGGNAFITQSVAPGTKVSKKSPELIYKSAPPPDNCPLEE